MAPKKKPEKKSAKPKAAKVAPARIPPVVPTSMTWEAGAIPYPPTKFAGHEYDPKLWVTCATMKRGQIVQLLREFENPQQKFKVLMVKGSPFVSLSISPTRGGND